MGLTSAPTRSVPHQMKTQYSQGALVEEYINPEESYALTHQHDLIPERQLMLSILEDALKQYLGKKRYGRVSNDTLKSEAAMWFDDPDDTRLYSFRSVCWHLSIDPEYVLRGLKNNTRAKVVRMAEYQLAKVIPYAEWLRNEDVEREVLVVFNCDGFRKNNLTQRDARALYFKTLLIAFRYSEEALIQERVRRGWKDVTRFLTRLYAQHFHPEHCEQLASALIKIAKDRRKVASAASAT